MAATSPTVLPSVLQNYDLTNTSGRKTFQFDLAQYLVQIQSILQTVQNNLSSATYLASVLNGSGALSSTALVAPNIAATTTTANPTVTLACDNAVSVSMQIAANSGTSGSVKFNMTHLPVAAPVVLKIFNNSGVSLTIIVNATDKNGTSCASLAFVGSGAAISMGSGRSLANATNQMYVGTLLALAGELDFIAV